MIQVFFLYQCNQCNICLSSNNKKSNPRNSLRLGKSPAQRGKITRFVNGAYWLDYLDIGSYFDFHPYSLLILVISNANYFYQNVCQDVHILVFFASRLYVLNCLHTLQPLMVALQYLYTSIIGGGVCSASHKQLIVPKSLIQIGFFQLRIKKIIRGDLMKICHQQFIS